MSLEEKINNKTVLTGIIGLGYVGLPLMHSICNSGGDVLGFDIDTRKVVTLNEGKSYLDTVPDNIIKRHRDTGNFEATNDFSKLIDVDVIVICVPTPLNKNNEPDLSYVVQTLEAISKTLRAEQLIILESTTYPGTLNEVMRPMLESASNLKAGKDFYLSFSPEREDPGNPNFETTTIPKIVGADTEKERILSVSFYQNFLKSIIPVSSSATAEAVKLTENIFRAVNIALINELKIIYDKMGIDIWEVIEGAKTKPFGYMPFYPGPGLGGHCIPIDPFYLTWKAKEIGLSTQFIELAGQINTSMPDYVVSKTKKVLLDNGKNINNSRLLIIGVAYKKDINDQRETPAFSLIEKYEAAGSDVDFYDPHIPEILPSREHSSLSGRKSIDWEHDKLKTYDAAIIVTDHSDVDYESLGNLVPIIIDTRNAMSRFSPSANVIKA